MVHIYISHDLKSLMDKALTLVCQGENQYIIVPEQLSYQMEHDLCVKGGDTVGLRAEVLSFSRLANRVSSIYGGVARPVLDKGGRMLAMASALEMVSSQLKLYGTAQGRPDLILKLLSAVDELKSQSITPENLNSAALELEGQFALKTQELGLILDSYQTVLATMGFDPADQLQHLAGQLEQEDYAEGKTFYFLGFSDFTGQQYQVIRQLMTFGAGVHMSLVAGEGDPEKGRGLVWDTYHRLGALCQDIGLEKDVQWLPGPAQPTALQQVQQTLFTPGASITQDGQEQVVLHQSQGLYQGALDLAGKLREAVKNGYRWRDLAVCCSQLDQARPILSALFETFQIPAYFAGSTPMVEKPVVSMVLAALRSATGNLDRQDVLAYLKSGLSSISVEECDLLDLYTYTWNISGAKWNRTWVMHPDGYGAELDEKAQEKLAVLNDIRSRGIEPLVTLQKALRQGTTIGQQAMALYNFLVEIQLENRLEELKKVSDSQKSQEFGQFFQVILDGIEQIFLILGEKSGKWTDFAKVFQGLLTQYEVGTIPGTADSVQVGNVSSLRFGHCKNLYVLGADDGVFPSQATENSLLTDWERQKLKGLGLPMTSQETQQLDRELGSTAQVLTSCENLLVLYTYGARPSMIFNQLVEKLPDRPLEQDEDFPSIYLSSPETFGAYLAGRISTFNGKTTEENGEIQEIWKQYGETIREQGEHQLGKLEKNEKKYHLSASKVEKFGACPMAYFMAYGLGLRQRKVANFDAPIFGTFVHWVLEEVVKKVKNQGGFGQIEEETLLKMTKDQVEQFQKDHGFVAENLGNDLSDRFLHLFSRNVAEVENVVKQLSNEMKCSKFEPAFFELEFSKNGQLPPIEIRGKQGAAELMGFVDRVDLYTQEGITYGRVVDYKTGKKTLDYTDIANGQGLQMLLYLFALCQGSEQAFGQKIHPAGVLYFPARRDVITSSVKKSKEEAAAMERASQGRSGLISSNPAVLAAMESYTNTPQYMPFKVNAKGEASGDLIEGGKMEVLRNHVFGTLEDLTDRLADGVVEPSPIVRGPDHNPCTYCEFGKICHKNSGEIKERPMVKCTSKEFWKGLEQEEHHG